MVPTTHIRTKRTIWPLIAEKDEEGNTLRMVKGKGKQFKSIALAKKASRDIQLADGGLGRGAVRVEE